MGYGHGEKSMRKRREGSGRCANATVMLGGAPEDRRTGRGGEEGEAGKEVDEDGIARLGSPCAPITLPSIHIGSLPSGGTYRVSYGTVPSIYPWSLLGTLSGRSGRQIVCP